MCNDLLFAAGLPFKAISQGIHSFRRDRPTRNITDQTKYSTKLNHANKYINKLCKQGKTYIYILLG